MPIDRVWIFALVLAAPAVRADDPPATTMSDPSIKFRRSDKPSAVLKRGDVEIVVVDNSAVDDRVLPSHRAGYSGIGSLTHAKRKENLFVPSFAGLNFEHIVDGTAHKDAKLLFEPRNWPMELRIVDENAVELYQKPTFHHALESCQRFELLPDGTIQLTVEVIPRKTSFKHGHFGLFWASYVHRPESLDIHFRGFARKDTAMTTRWIRGVTPRHGDLSTHVGPTDDRTFPYDKPFPLTLVHSMSESRYAEPWYFGVNHGMAFVQMFRPKDRVRLTQSPSGGGAGNPAWDFQYFVDEAVVDRRYQFVMRAAYLPFESNEQIEKATRERRAQLER